MGKRQFRELDGFIKNLKQDYSDAIVYLFGSRARGDELKDSDYDVILGIFFPQDIMLLMIFQLLVAKRTLKHKIVLL